MYLKGLLQATEEATHKAGTEAEMEETRKDWALTADVAANLFATSELSQQDRAFVGFARCRALSNLDRFSLALQPGQVEVFLAEQLGDANLLGQALLELAFVHLRLNGQERESIDTYKLFLRQHRRCYSGLLSGPGADRSAVSVWWALSTLGEC